MGLHVTELKRTQHARCMQKISATRNTAYVYTVQGIFPGYTPRAGLFAKTHIINILPLATTANRLMHTILKGSLYDVCMCLRAVSPCCWEYYVINYCCFCIPSKYTYSYLYYCMSWMLVFFFQHKRERRVINAFSVRTWKKTQCRHHTDRYYHHHHIINYPSAATS